MRFLIIFFMFVCLNANQLQITKYVDNAVSQIAVQYKNLPIDLQKMVSIDTKIVAHYQVDFVGHIDALNAKINYAKLSKFNYLLRLNYKNKQLSAILYDLTKKKVLFYKIYKIPSFNVYPFMIHTLSYDINSALSFSPINWIKRKVVYSVRVAPKQSDIFLADITLTYRKRIIAGGLNIFPKWADKKQDSIYFTKLQREPTLYKYNIYTGQKNKILSAPGMLIVSDVKGDKLLLTLAPNDQPDIYGYDLDTKELRRITKYSGIDVNGQFYGENSVVFISNRLGYPAVYQKNLDTGVVSKLIYYGKNQISVSAYKNLVVLSSRESNNAFGDNTFNLLLVDKNSDFVKRLTLKGKNMMPVFSSDGSTILFIKEYRFDSKFGIIRLKENKIFYFRLSRIIQSFDW